VSKRTTTQRRDKPAADSSQEKDAVTKSGWKLYAHPVILDQIEKLEARVREEAHPSGDAAKVLKWVTNAIFEEIPQDPTLAAYRQGDALGKGKTHWFRDKYAGRFRLFFRYSSKAKVIIYGWVNDAQTLRTYGAKSDAYATFRSMLDKGSPPNDWSDLLKEASAPQARKRLKSKAG
jgi:toxin YhaV